MKCFVLIVLDELKKTAIAIWDKEEKSMRTVRREGDTEMQGLA